MILLLSNERDATADFFEIKLKMRGVPYHRLNTERLGSYWVDFQVSQDCVQGAFGVPSGQRLDVDDIKSVYYRRPRPPNVSDELSLTLRPWVQSEYRKLWGGLLNANASWKWVNHPLAISAANYKPEQLARAARLGLDVPPTLITNDPESAESFCRRLDWRVVVKPIGHGQVQREEPHQDALIYTNRIDREHAAKLSAVAVCPTLFQAYVEKAFDLRITVVGDQCIAVELDSQQSDVSRVDCRRANMAGMRYAVVHVCSDLRAKLLTLTRSYGLRFAAIDLAVDRAGRDWFLELNPAGQWAWLEERVGVPISDALIRTLCAA